MVATPQRTAYVFLPLLATDLGNRVLQPMQPTNAAGAGGSPGPSGKLYKGKLLPVAISSTDKLGLSRVAQKVRCGTWYRSAATQLASMKGGSPPYHSGWPVCSQVADLGDKVMLPRLCSCPNSASPFDAAYVQKCARNCPLYGQTARYVSRARVERDIMLG
jgi:hypothetical protein